MNMFLVYMAGNSISIFPIMMIGMIIIRSVKALFTVQQGYMPYILILLYRGAKY